MTLHRLSRFLQRQHQAVFANRKTNSGSAGAAQRFRKPVVAPAAEDRILRPQSAVGEFKRRPRVVVEPAHQSIVERKRHADSFQDLLHLLEMLAATFIQKLR